MKKQVIALVIVYLSIAALLVAIYFLFTHLLEYQAAGQEYDRLRQYVGEIEEMEVERQENRGAMQQERDVDWAALKSINEDFIGWISIPGTNIEYPVVQGQDNEYYLHHTFSRQQNSSGSIFIDSNIENPLEVQNLIVYGHNMMDGSIFADLKKLLQQDFLNQHNRAYLHTEEEIYEYELFAAYTVPYDSDVYTYQFGSEESFEIYWSQIGERAVAYRALEFSENAQMLTLSTCHGNNGTKNRCIVQGIRINNNDL